MSKPGIRAGLPGQTRRVWPFCRVRAGSGLGGKLQEPGKKTKCFGKLYSRLNDTLIPVSSAVF